MGNQPWPQFQNDNGLTGQNYKNIVNLWMKTTESYREPVDGKFADDTERILQLIEAQNAGPGEDDDDEDIEHESEQ